MLRYYTQVCPALYVPALHLHRIQSESTTLCMGGVLSPLLYLIYVANITNGFAKLVQVSQFANDIALYTNVLPFSKGKRLLEKGVEVIHTNLLNLELVLSFKKIKLVHFNKKKIAPGSTFITVSGHKIRSVECTRFLGINFDFELSFKQQVKSVSLKYEKAYRILKYICGT